ncbi:MAG: FkbM family methyltransferase, partial [Acidimicrobiales bacterium]|nr:FkbM family methyltransferase [Acidimicrobiales bacterium]
MNDDHGGVRRLTKRARGAARAALFQTLWKRGYVLRRIDEGGWAPANVAKPGLAPKTLIDVGVGTGTVGLHEAFPAAHHVFVEPLPGFERDLKRLVAKFGGEYHLVAAGAEDGTAVFHLDRSIPMQSSLALPIDHEDRSLEEVEVTVARLDSLRERQGWKGPFGLKLDTEGHELEVIEGAPRLIEETEFVI